jgi:hypothetical protein
MPLSTEAQAELNRRADRMSSILNTPGWIEIEAEAGRKIERLKKVAAALALSPDGADQRKLDTIRGTIAALNWFVGVPKTAQATLEKFLREQGIELEEDFTDEQPGRVDQRA